jgi:hypothetical protein
VELLARLEILETSYLSKDEELSTHLSCFVADQTQLAKAFRRDVDELKRMQQEHMSKLDMHSNPLPFDELIQRQVTKYYHHRHSDGDDEDDEEEEDDQAMTESDKLHEQHVLWLKKKKKDSKVRAPLIERLRKFPSRCQPCSALLSFQRNSTIISRCSAINESLSIVFLRIV